MYQFLFIVMLAAVFHAEVESIDVGTFSTSYAVYHSYMSPGRNTVYLNFYNSNNDILLHLNPRYEWGCPTTVQNTLVLNTQVDYKWQTPEKPAGFPFFPYEFTSIIITPQASAYHIVAQAADTTFTYDFSYRHGSTASDVTRVIGKSFSNTCPPGELYLEYALSIGYHIPIYSCRSVGTVINVTATAPSTGDMAVDIILGTPEEKNNLPVALKVKFYFGQVPSISLLSDVYGVHVDKQILSNPVEAGSSFIFSIVLVNDGYELALDGAHLATFNHVIPLPTTPDPATVWVTGVAALEKIDVQ